MSPIAVFEDELDTQFEESSLMDLPYPQAVWHLFSAAEDLLFQLQRKNPLTDRQLEAFSDNMINAITHPMRCLLERQHEEGEGGERQIESVRSPRFDQDAKRWLEVSRDYNSFSIIFPLWHRKKIDLEVVDGELIPKINQGNDFSYEAYNLIVGKDGGEARDPKDQYPIGSEEVFKYIVSNLKVKGATFEMLINPRLAKTLSNHCSPQFSRAYILPEGWKSTKFTVADFRTVFTMIQSLMAGHFMAKQIAINLGVESMAYDSGVILMPLHSLTARLVRYTGVQESSIVSILEFITFGSQGVRNPDIATQPLILFESGICLLAPVVWLNVDSERNLCVLLNQVPSERKLYSRLVQDKEDSLRGKVMLELAELGLRFESGNLANTDLDLAVIDDDKKLCMIFELKWFIEPAEAREVVQRSEELIKGVAQCKKILELFKNGDSKLIKEILKIDREYTVHAGVGSRNWIGHHNIQDPEIPIIKIMQWVKKVKELGGLSASLEWLMGREYLPVRGVDFEPFKRSLQVGVCKGQWYEFKLSENID